MNSLDNLNGEYDDCNNNYNSSMNLAGFCEMNDDNKYVNLGLSLSSQELIVEFYQALSFESSSSIKTFEEILYSILEDIQKYKSDIRRLEKSYKNEKEKNDEMMKHMIEEAENQMVTLTNKVKEEEKMEYEKVIEKLHQDYKTEIACLQQNLTKMQELERNYSQNKIEESQQINDLKEEIKNLLNENKELRIELRESQTQLSVLRSEIAELKVKQKENVLEQCQQTESIHEINSLKQEINILHKANKKLNDTNDILRDEIESLRQAEDTSLKQNSFVEKEVVPVKNLSYAGGNFKFKNNPSIIHSSFETDEEMDSGYLASVADNELSDETDHVKIKKSVSVYSNRTDSDASDYSLSCATTDNFLYERNDSLNNLSSQQSLPINNYNPKLKYPYALNSNSQRVGLNVASNINNASNAVPERMFKVIFAGDSAVGKTSFIMKYCKGTFVNTTSSTLGVDFHMKMLELDGKKMAIQLWDTCGQERFRSIAKSYFRRADGVVLMYDCTYEKSFLNVRDWINVISESSDKRLPIVLIGNKTDLREECGKKRKCVEYEDGYRLARQHQASFMETSAKDGSNIEESLIELSRLMSKNQDIELISDSIKLVSNESTKKCC